MGGQKLGSWINDPNQTGLTQCQTSSLHYSVVLPETVTTTMPMLTTEWEACVWFLKPAEEEQHVYTCVPVRTGLWLWKEAVYVRELNLQPLFLFFTFCIRAPWHFAWFQAGLFYNYCRLVCLILLSLWDTLQQGQPLGVLASPSSRMQIDGCERQQRDLHRRKDCGGCFLPADMCTRGMDHTVISGNNYPSSAISLQ